MAERVRPSPAADASTARAPTRDGIRLRSGVKALIATGSAALLIRERHADGTPFWTLPGGGVRPGESHSAALRRELAEELRAACVPGDHVGRFWYAHASRPRTVSRYAVRGCALLSRPTPAAARGVTDLRWVERDSLPTTTLPQVRLLVERALE